MRSGVPDQLGQYGETLSLLKIQKLAGCGGGCLQSQLLGRLRQENHLNPGGGGCIELRSCPCTPAWDTARLHLKTKNKQTKKQKPNDNNNNNNKKPLWPGAVAHACNSNLLGGR
uniref:Uncharacterized protein n=1 Tax=Macaca fascicularis TaxID=9541 RepID=A0A7N9CTK0_MACFA